MKECYILGEDSNVIIGLTRDLEGLPNNYFCFIFKTDDHNTIRFLFDKKQAKGIRKALKIHLKRNKRGEI